MSGFNSYRLSGEDTAVTSSEQTNRPEMRLFALVCERAGNAHIAVRSMVFLFRRLPERPSQLLISALQAILDFVNVGNFILSNVSQGCAC